MKGSIVATHKAITDEWVWFSSRNSLKGFVLAGIYASNPTSAKQTLFLRRLLISSKFDKIILIDGMIVKVK